MNTELEETLYAKVPDRLYWHSNREAWYACYDSELCILTNASSKLEAYCYNSKPEYRDARSAMVEAYKLRKGKVHYFDDENR
jgi:hypothetical protein